MPEDYNFVWNDYNRKISSIPSNSKMVIIKLKKTSFSMWLHRQNIVKIDRFSGSYDFIVSKTRLKETLEHFHNVWRMISVIE